MIPARLPLYLALLIGLALVTGGARGELFKWIDDKGAVHYGDAPPDNADLRRITGKVSSYSSATVEPFVYEKSTPTNHSRGVIMYSTSWCGYCKQAAAHFRRKGIAFSERDIEKSPGAAREFKRLNGRGVPVILVGKQRMNGFDAAAFDHLYAGKS